YGVDGFATIQDGENAVNSGGLVDVLRGTYQYFTANKASTIQSHFGNTSATVTGGDIGGTDTLNLPATNSTLDGLTVTNPNYGAVDPGFFAQTGDPQGIALGWYGDTLSNVHVKNNIVTAIANARTINGNQTPIFPAFGIQVGGDVTNFEIDHNVVSN